MALPWSWRALAPSWTSFRTRASVRFMPARACWPGVPAEATLWGLAAPAGGSRHSRLAPGRSECGDGRAPARRRACSLAAVARRSGVCPWWAGTRRVRSCCPALVARCRPDGARSGRSRRPSPRSAGCWNPARRGRSGWGGGVLSGRPWPGSARSGSGLRRTATGMVLRKLVYVLDLLEEETGLERSAA